MHVMAECLNIKLCLKNICDFTKRKYKRGEYKQKIKKNLPDKLRNL